MAVDPAENDETFLRLMRNVILHEWFHSEVLFFLSVLSLSLSSSFSLPTLGKQNESEEKNN